MNLLNNKVVKASNINILELIFALEDNRKYRKNNPDMSNNEIKIARKVMLTTWNINHSSKNLKKILGLKEICEKGLSQKEFGNVVKYINDTCEYIGKKYENCKEFKDDIFLDKLTCSKNSAELFAVMSIQVLQNNLSFYGSKKDKVEPEENSEF